MASSTPGSYWAAWITLVLAVWELFAAFIWKYGNHFVMTGNAAFVGALILMFAFWSVATGYEWSSWVTLALGAWLVASGLVFERSLTKAMLNDVVVGVLLMVFSYIAARYARKAWERGWSSIPTGEGHLMDF
jgi:VIT1/CCC1 family predicted Fe2+/Mn2+ transporter